MLTSIVVTSIAMAITTWGMIVLVKLAQRREAARTQSWNDAIEGVAAALDNRPAKR